MNMEQKLVTTIDHYAVPTAVVLADRLVGGELKDIFGDLEVASLVIAGKTVIEHTLLELQELRVKQCTIFAGKNASRIQKLLEKESLWGMSVTVLNSSRSVDQVLSEFNDFDSNGGVLIIEADRLRSSCLKSLLRQTSGSEHLVFGVNGAGNRLGITLKKSALLDVSMKPVAISQILVNRLETAKDFQRANFDVVSGDYEGLEPGVMFNTQLGRRQHWTSHLSTSTIAASLGLAPNNKAYWSNVMIDRHCKVGDAVKMESVILNHGVYVESGSNLEHTIVMPNSVVSSARALSDCIVHHDAIFDLS